MILYKNQEVAIKERSLKKNGNSAILTVQIKNTNETIRVKLRELIFFRKRKYENNK